MSRSQRVRVIRRALALWRAGRPHAALDLLAEAGMSDYIPAFQRAAFAAARARYKRLSSRYSGPSH